MKPTQPLRYNFEFSRVYKRGRHFSGRCVVLHVFRRHRGVLRNRKPVTPHINRIGITVSRRVKGAVCRNRMKRRLREAFRVYANKLILGYDVVVMAKANPSEASFQMIVQDLGYLLRRAGLIEEET